MFTRHPGKKADINFPQFAEVAGKLLPGVDINECVRMNDDYTMAAVDKILVLNLLEKLGVLQFVWFDDGDG